MHERINSHYWTSQESIDARDARKARGRRRARGTHDSDDDSESASEDEADLDGESDGAEEEAAWGDAEDSVLLTKWDSVKDLESRFDLLAFEGALLANDRTAEQVKKRARFLGLLSGGGIASRLRRTRRGAQQDADAALIVPDGAIAAEIRREQQLQQMASIRQAAKGLISAASGGKKQGERT